MPGDVAAIVGQLRARAAIEQLIAEFAYSVDIGNGKDTADLFTPDGWYESDTGRSTGRDAIRLAYERRAARGERTARHLFTNIRIEQVTETTYRGTSQLLLFAEDGPPPKPALPLLVSDVTDTYVVNESAAWFESRILRTVFIAEGSEPVLPLGQP